MPSVVHMALIDMFRRRPRMAAAFLKAKLKRKLPAFDRIELASESHTVIQTPEFHSDLVLESRGILLTDAQRAQLDAATDPDLVTRWFQRALTADSADAIFVNDDAAAPS